MIGESDGYLKLFVTERKRELLPQKTVDPTEERKVHG